MPFRARRCALRGARPTPVPRRRVGHRRAMTGVRHPADSAKAEAGDALAGARRKAAGDRPSTDTGPRAILALQRYAGNAAVSALIAARLRSPGEQAVTEIDAAL